MATTDAVNTQEVAASKGQTMKTFLSIGAGPGMGFATAERFAKEGFHVVLAARSVARTRELVERLIASGYSSSVREVDSGDPGSVAELVADLQQQHGAI